MLPQVHACCPSTARLLMVPPSRISPVWQVRSFNYPSINYLVPPSRISPVWQVRYFNHLSFNLSDIYFDILNERGGWRNIRPFRRNFSSYRHGLARVGSFKNFGDNTGYCTCNSVHELKDVTFDAFYYEFRVGTWCPYQDGPFSLKTDVPCSEKPEQLLYRLSGSTLHKNRLEIGNCYFIHVTNHETIMQVQHNTFSQYIIGNLCSVYLLYPSKHTEQNPRCPMLRANIFNCTVGMKFWNGTKLVHLDGAIGEPQDIQRNSTSGVTFVMQEGGKSAVVVLHPLLSGGRQVLGNSTQMCRDSTAMNLVCIIMDRCVVLTISKVTTPPIRPELTQACERIKGTLCALHVLHAVHVL